MKFADSNSQYARKHFEIMEQELHCLVLENITRTNRKKKRHKMPWIIMTGSISKVSSLKS